MAAGCLAAARVCVEGVGEVHGRRPSPDCYIGSTMYPQYKVVRSGIGAAATISGSGGGGDDVIIIWRRRRARGGGGEVVAATTARCTAAARSVPPRFGWAARSDFDYVLSHRATWPVCDARNRPFCENAPKSAGCQPVL